MKLSKQDRHCPHCWLAAQVNSAKKVRLQEIIVDFMCVLHGDDIERVLGKRMKHDGYFKGQRKADQAEEGPSITLGAGADLQEGE